MKLLSALLLSFALIGCASVPMNTAPSFANIPAELYEWGDEYVWSVKRFNEGDPLRPKGMTGHGSGVWLNDTTMVTACHVPSNETEMWASQDGGFADGVYVDLAVEFCHRWKDQAVMSVVAGDHRVDPVILGTLPERGERVYIIGFPADSPLTVTTGWFVGKSVSKVAADKSEWVLAADAMGGNSGGAIVVIRDNEIQLVGILVSGYDSGHIVQMRDLTYSLKWLQERSLL